MSLTWARTIHTPYSENVDTTIISLSLSLSIALSVYMSLVCVNVGDAGLPYPLQERLFVPICKERKKHTTTTAITTTTTIEAKGETDWGKKQTEGAPTRIELDESW